MFASNGRKGSSPRKVRRDFIPEAQQISLGVSAQICYLLIWSPALARGWDCSDWLELSRLCPWNCSWIKLLNGYLIPFLICSLTCIIVFCTSEIPFFPQMLSILLHCFLASSSIDMKCNVNLIFVVWKCNLYFLFWMLKNIVILIVRFYYNLTRSWSFYFSSYLVLNGFFLHIDISFGSGKFSSFFYFLKIFLFLNSVPSHLLEFLWHGYEGFSSLLSLS